MKEFSLLDTSHIFSVIACIAMIIYLPKFVLNKNHIWKKLIIVVIFVFILINQGLDFYREGYTQQIKLGLPLHLCDFSCASIMMYFITQRREFFIFAFFAGIAGAGMAILTPDVVYAFPHIDYVRHMIGHSMILLGVSYAMIIDNQRPYLKDVHKVLFVLTIFLFLMYPINYLLGPPANYWYVIEKPPGLNVTDFMRDAPFHMLDIYLLAVIVFYSIYSPYLIKDKLLTNKKSHEESI